MVLVAANVGYFGRLFSFVNMFYRAVIIFTEAWSLLIVYNLIAKSANGFLPL